mmetsp:Transcript_9504/g.20597  ORF Transcript_9504/g.20597 Transcript_9504/m.20597 type:complete len:358 (+) Transcript_9504:255-1328(+)
MIPSTKPCKEMRPNEQQASVRSPPEMIRANRTNRNDWADANGQVDYFVSAGFNNDSIYRTALTPGGTYVSISPIRPSTRPANAGTADPKPRTYPSQELNTRYQCFQLSPPRSGGSVKPPPLPPTQANEKKEEATNVSKFSVEEVFSVESGSPTDFKTKFRAEEVALMTTGLTQGLDDLSTKSTQSFSHSPNINVLDSFEIDGVDTASLAAGRPKSDGPGDDNLTAPKQDPASTTPSSNYSEMSAALSLKKMQRGERYVPVGIVHPTDLDILRGRGGLTNRHAGNMRFRDEARTLRTEYRDQDTSRQEKFMLSQKLAKRVREYGGRFLEKGADNLWHEMNEKDARKKASQVLREEKWD